MVVYVKSAFEREFQIDDQSLLDFDSARGKWFWHFENNEIDDISSSLVSKDGNDIIIKFKIPDSFFTVERIGDCSNQIVLYDMTDDTPIWYSKKWYDIIKKPIGTPI